MPCTTTCRKPSPSQAHCGTCHRTFGSVSGFDQHRRGGECRDPDTLTGHAAMHLDHNGIWRYDGGQQRADAHSAPLVQRQGYEMGSVVGRGGSGPSGTAEMIPGGSA